MREEPTDAERSYQIEQAREDARQRELLVDAWTDPTPLTLDVLRRELGEPVREKKTKSGARILWGVFTVDERGEEVWDWCVEWCSFLGREATTVNDVDVETLGQLRRILSVIQETTPGGGAAEK